jgi:hypothetical protein
LNQYSDVSGDRASVNSNRVSDASVEVFAQLIVYSIGSVGGGMMAFLSAPHQAF